MPHLLDLYCGTKSVSNAFAEYDWKTTTVDIDPACKPDICKNVLKLTKADLPDDIDAIWASPLCTHYSRARTTAKTPRDLEGSDKLVAKVLEIASWFNAPYFIENPDGLLKTRPVVEGIPMRLVDYCQYKDEPGSHDTANGPASGRTLIGCPNVHFAIPSNALAVMQTESTLIRRTVRESVERAKAALQHSSMPYHRPCQRR